jgi:adenylate cyclase
MAYLDYTQRASRFSLRFPLLNSVLIQVNFWLLANTVLAVLMHLMYRSVNETVALPLPTPLWPTLLIGIIIGILYGAVQGFTEYFLEKQFFRKRSLGITFLLKLVVSLLTLTFLFGLVRFVLFEQLILPVIQLDKSPLNETSWRYTFFIFLVYYFMMAIVITFITQVNKKYGPGVLVPLLMGKYRQPKEEERIFMFMDLQSSTTIAEQLGHLRYSSFIRDSFWDINQVIAKHQAEIYQYVGDEIVLSWRMPEGLKELACIRFYFACSEQFAKRAAYYKNAYGRLPFFKAGVHGGKITAVEIGEIKRDIAYHGDSINTAARIQSLCNTYNKSLLVSKGFTEVDGFDEEFSAVSLGLVSLKGKQEGVELVSVEGRVSGEQAMGK